MVIDYSIQDIEQPNIPWSTQDVLNDEYCYVMEQVNCGEFDYISKYFKKEMKLNFEKGILFKLLQEDHEGFLKQEIKNLVIKTVKKMSRKYDIHWDYEIQRISKKHKKLISKVSQKIKSETRHKNFKVSSIYTYGDIGIYVARSAFIKAQIGIDFENLLENLEENNESNLEKEIYITILHELKHADQDLEHRLEVDDPELEDEAENYGRTIAEYLLKNTLKEKEIHGKPY